MRVLSMKRTPDNHREQQCATIDGMRTSGRPQLLLTLHVTAVVWVSTFAASKSLMPDLASSSSSSSPSPSPSSADSHSQHHHLQLVKAGFEPESFPPLSSVTCWNFSVGNRQLGELYSPNYGQHYPSKTECIHLIIAPDQQRVRLDFRDDFHIEPSEDCGNDQLEIRDGPFGYSRLVGRFCGTIRPPLIESTGGYLWLRFYSDDSIEYIGFRAVYEYYSPREGTNNADICRIDVDREMPDGLASEVDVPVLLRDKAIHARVPIDCTWVFQAQVPQQTVFLRWQKYVMSTMHLCDDSFLEVYDGTTGQVNRRQTFCDSTARDLRSTTSTMYLRLYASSVEKMPNFTVLYTYLMTGPCGDGSDVGLFDCGDKSCIDRSLLCNGRHNCNTSRDESLCINTTEQFPDHEVPGMIRYHTLIIGIVGGAVLTITLLSICAAYRQTSKDRQLRRRRRLAASKMENHCSSSSSKFELTEMQKDAALEPASPGGQHPRQQQQYQQQRHQAMMTTPLVEPETCSSPANHFDPTRFRRLSNGSRPNTTSRMFQFVDSVSGLDGGTTGSTEIDGEDLAAFNADGLRRKLCETANPQCHPAQNVISAVATIEKLPSSPVERVRGGTAAVARDSWAVRRDSTPSPRPDVVQDEKFFSTCIPTPRPSSGRGCAPSPPVRRTAVDGKASGAKRDAAGRPSCNRTRSVENAAMSSSNIYCGVGGAGVGNGVEPEESATCGSYRDPEAIRSYKRLDFDDPEELFRRDASSSKAFVRFSPDWSAAVTLRRPPFPRDYTGLESSSASARSAPSLILPLFQGQNAYGSFHQGYRMPAASTTHTGAFTAVPSSGSASVVARSSAPLPPAASSMVSTNRTHGAVSPMVAASGSSPGVVTANSTAGVMRHPGTGAYVTLGDQKSALKAPATSGARTADGPSKSRRRSKSPDIFYTRPNRGILKS